MDSTSHLQRSDGTRDKSAPAILAVVKCFVVGMEVPHVFRPDNGSEYRNRIHAKCCDGLMIYRNLTAPYTGQQNGPVERALARTVMAGLTARLEVYQLLPDVHLERVRA